MNLIKSSGKQCKHSSVVLNSGPNMTKVTMEENMMVEGDHLITYKNIDTLHDCINICHMTKQCVGYEYYSENFPDMWNKKICNLKRSITGFKNASFVTSGHSFYVCSSLQMLDHEAIGQNIRTSKVNDSSECQESCKTTPGCVGYSLNNNLCFLKSNIEYFQYQKDSSSEQVCYRPSSYVNMSISGDNVLGIQENII